MNVLSSAGSMKLDPDGVARFHARITHLSCGACGGMGFLDAGAAIASCAACDGDGVKRIGDVMVTHELASRLQRFAERGE